MKYAIVIEKSDTGYGAYAPDLPGVGVTASTLDEARTLLRDAIDLHLQGLREDGDPIPQPTTQIEFIEATAA
jgi:predicted RNase H-like HicB family nuclease